MNTLVCVSGDLFATVNSLRPPRMLRLYICLYVCRLAGLLKKLWVDFQEEVVDVFSWNFWKL